MQIKMDLCEVKSESADEEILPIISGQADCTDDTEEALAEQEHSAGELKSPEPDSNRQSIDDTGSQHEENGADSQEEPPSGSNLADSLGFNLLCESSRLAITDVAMREQRCRTLEREANELKDMLYSMSHMVHILENIKRVSREYIRKMYEMVNEGTSSRPDRDQERATLRQQSIIELDIELKQWERKYGAIHNSTNAMSFINSATEAMFAATKMSWTESASGPSMSNGTHHNSSSCNLSDTQNELSEEIADGHDSVADIELEQNGRPNVRSVSSNEALPNPLMLMNPQELCEMSMETHEMEANAANADNGTNNRRQAQRAAAAAAAAAAAFMMNPSHANHGSASSPLIAAAVAAATAAENTHHKNLSHLKQQLMTVPTATAKQSHGSERGSQNGVIMKNVDNALSTPTGVPSSSSSSSSKPLFLCDHPGCQYQTNMRQRLAMHKRAHAGEMLFSCDIPGCGYQSNYKGNIKIHKKHRHRIESSGEQASSYLVADNNGVNQKFRTRGRKRKVAPSASHQSGASLRHGRLSVIVNEDGGEVYVGGADGDGHNNNSSAELYSGNDSTGAKECDLPSYECEVEGCNYRTKWKQCLTAHRFLHEGVKPFRCDHPGCNYRTNFKGNVNVHKRVHRASEFQCKFAGCNFSTPWKNSFMIHQRNHTPAVPSPNVAAPSNAAHLGHNGASLVESDGSVPLVRRRTDPAEQASSSSASGRMALAFDSTSNGAHSLDGSVNGGGASPTEQHLLNGPARTALQQSLQVGRNGQPQPTDLVNLLTNGHFTNGLKEEDDDEEEEEEEEGDEEDEEEEMQFGVADPSSHHAFLMAEAANAVSQANAAHLAALRHGAHPDQLRPNVMFDLTRYQEMI